jgi:molybdenum ABC transporter, periplasmic molybdate-binding protein
MSCPVNSEVNILSNSLVLVSAAPAPVSLAELPSHIGDGRLAMALTGAVPAGQYGREALVALGLWDELSPQIVETDNVRAALRLVALGEAAYGIVYRTDGLAEEDVFVVDTVPPETHRPILYPAALLTETEVAKAFLDYLGSDPARAIFAEDGFGIPNEPAK